jgi:hypothetical protein
MVNYMNILRKAMHYIFVFLAWINSPRAIQKRRDFYKQVIESIQNLPIMQTDSDHHHFEKDNYNYFKPILIFFGVNFLILLLVIVWPKAEAVSNYDKPTPYLDSYIQNLSYRTDHLDKIRNSRLRTKLMDINSLVIGFDQSEIPEASLAKDGAGICEAVKGYTNELQQKNKLSKQQAFDLNLKLAIDKGISNPRYQRLSDEVLWLARVDMAFETGCPELKKNWHASRYSMR